MATAATHRSDNRVRGWAMGRGSGPAMFNSCKIADARWRQRLPGHHPRACERRPVHPGPMVAAPRARLDLLRQLTHHRRPEEPGGIGLVLERDALSAPAVELEVRAFDATQPRRIPHDREPHDNTGRRRCERPKQRTVVDRDRPAVAKLGGQLGIARNEPGGTRRGEHRDRERQLPRPGILEQPDASADVLHLTGLELIGDELKALGGERVAGLPERGADVLGHRVPTRSERLEDRMRTGLLGEPHHDGPEPVWSEQYDEPSEIDHEALASGYGVRGGEGCAGGSTRANALSSCPSAVPPSGASVNTTAKRRLSKGSRIAWAANCRVRGMNQAAWRAPAPDRATAAYCSNRASRKAPLDGNCR